MNTAEMLETGRMLRQQDRDSAIDYYEQQRQKAAISYDRELWLASTLTLAWELLESGQPDQELIEQTIPVVSPDYPYLILAQGRKLMAEGQFKQAIALLQTPLTTDDLELQGLISDALGRCFSISHQFDQAKPHYDRAVALLSPDSFYLGFVSIHLGEMYLFSQDFDHSEDQAQMALETEDPLLRFNALVLLTKVALRNDRIEMASALIEDAQALIDPDTDPLEVVTLSLLQIEVFCKQGDTPSALSVWEYIHPLVGELYDWQTKQQAQHLEGKLGIGKIAEGLVNLNEEVVENLEDLLLDGALQYEERGMYTAQALVLLDMAWLYSFAVKLPTPYQFQGKSLRSVEQAGQLLQKVGLKQTKLSQEIEQLYDRMLDRLPLMP